MAIITRLQKKSELSYGEVDNNFSELDSRLTGNAAQISALITAVADQTATIARVSSTPSTKSNYWTKRSTVVDNMDNGATNWTVAAGTITKSSTTDHALGALGGTTSLRIDTPSSFASIQRTIPATVFTGTIDFWVYLTSDPSTSTGFTVLLSKDSFTSYIMLSFTEAQYLRSGWNRLSVNVAEDGTYWSNAVTPPITGSTSFADAMTGIRIQLGGFQQNSPTTGAPVSLYLGGICYGGTGKPNVLMGWDDSYASQWTVFNIFRTRGLTGSMSIIPPSIGTGGLTLTQLHEMYDWGWDIVNHTMHSTVGNIASDTDAVVRTKIGGARDWMLNNGFTRTANVLVWPENNYNDRVLSIAQEYGIQVTRGQRNRFTRTHQGIDNPLRLGSASLSSVTLAQAKKFLDAATLYTSTILLAGHGLTGTSASPAAGGTPPVNGLDWYYNDYAALADDIADRVTAGTMNCINYSQLIANCRI